MERSVGQQGPGLVERQKSARVKAKEVDYAAFCGPARDPAHQIKGGLYQKNQNQAHNEPVNRALLDPNAYLLSRTHRHAQALKLPAVSLPTAYQDKPKNHSADVGKVGNAGP